MNDIHGAQVLGMKGILVKTGMYSLPLGTLYCFVVNRKV